MTWLLVSWSVIAAKVRPFLAFVYKAHWIYTQVIKALLLNKYGQFENQTTATTTWSR
jgi:hypothetical protein